MSEKYSFIEIEIQKRFEDLCDEAQKLKHLFKGEIMYDFNINPLGAQLNFIKLQRNNPPWVSESDMVQLIKVNAMAKKLEPLFWKEKEKRDEAENLKFIESQSRLAESVWKDQRENPTQDNFKGWDK